MNKVSVEERIRARAYELWHEDGGLEGCADEYWHPGPYARRKGDGSSRLWGWRRSGRVTGLSVCHESLSIGSRKGRNSPLAAALDIENE